ncbi:carboxymuconolactone decarboxylase family protein [Pseudonocardia sp. HH130630-07]|uniref:carboxymuconolactone decarboxylase family protein n=1 Tax=Pseudonocardia sp. HH130630-07 TaxID=1690815 RepID=UPI000814FAA4|nr:carboxymuconolactone decarboxylase family protein [Pseudonocardia sp. HH130630-07]ANY07244.1 alkylhydroperoxidase [Pseudonocardia sp. HH130630-07]
MTARIDYLTEPTAVPFVEHVMGLGAALKRSSLPPVTQELVALRVSQINGCAPCLGMHTAAAAAAGETPVRLALLAAWREATVFTPAERAALEIAEQGTRIADGATGVSDDAWADAAAHHDDAQLTALVTLVSFLNAVNRLNVLTARPADGDLPARFRPAAHA